MSPPFGGESSRSLFHRQVPLPSPQRPPPRLANRPKPCRSGRRPVKLDQVAEFLVEPGRGDPPRPVEQSHVRTRLPRNRHFGRKAGIPYERVRIFRESGDAESPAGGGPDPCARAPTL